MFLHNNSGYGAGAGAAVAFTTKTRDMFFHYVRGTDPSAYPASARTFLMIDKSWEGSTIRACKHGCCLHAFGSPCHVVSLYCDNIKLGSRFQGLSVVVKEERVQG